MSDIMLAYMHDGHARVLSRKKVSGMEAHEVGVANFSIATHYCISTVIIDIIYTLRESIISMVDNYESSFDFSGITRRWKPN